MARPRTPIGTFGDIDFTTLGPERVRARTRIRDFDGRVRRVEATAPSKKLAEHGLKEKLVQRATLAGGSRQLTPDSSFKELVEVWLADLDLEGGLAPSTRTLYERNMRQLVLPAFEHYTLREVTIGRIELFLKSLAANKSYSYAKQAKTVLNLALGLAARYEAIPKNPVREAKRMKKPQSQAVSLTHASLVGCRDDSQRWRLRSDRGRLRSSRHSQHMVRPQCVPQQGGRSRGAEDASRYARPPYQPALHCVQSLPNNGHAGLVAPIPAPDLAAAEEWVAGRADPDASGGHLPEGPDEDPVDESLVDAVEELVRRVAREVDIPLEPEPETDSDPVGA